MSFDELVNENRRQILKDREQMEKIEERLDKEKNVPLFQKSK
ncbi:MAG TPA: FbpB family small basic protein [Bacillota bacterium]|nr:FbpB family small basic protein [Bacillota bacterium]